MSHPKLLPVVVILEPRVRRFLIRQLDRLAPTGTFRRNVLTMIGGGALGQGLIIATAPILTRLYAPEDFGVYGLYFGITAAIGTIVTWRYELSIMLAKDAEEAASLLVLSFIITIGMSGLALLGVIFFRQVISADLGAPELARWLWGLPISLLAIGFYSTLTVWRSRRMHFKRISVARVGRSGTTAAIQLAAGLVKVAGPGGLVVGDVLGTIVAAGMLGGLGPTGERLLWNRGAKDKILSSLLRYRKFALFSMPAGMFNHAAHYFPLILLGYFFGPVTVGYFFLAQRVLGLPMSVVGQSVSQVFYQRLAKEKLEGGSPHMLLIRGFTILAIIGLAGGAISAPFLPLLFSEVFGIDWSRAGYFTQLMLPLFLCRFAVSPLTQTLIVYEKQELEMYWQLCFMLGASGSMVAGGLLHNVSLSILSYSIFSALMYLTHITMSLRIAGRKPSHSPVS